MKPKFSPDQDMMNVSPEDVAEAKKRAKATKAYDKASSTKPAPKAYAKGGMVRGQGAVSRTKKCKTV
jgi:hypothetical protein